MLPGVDIAHPAVAPAIFPEQFEEEGGERSPRWVDASPVEEEGELRTVGEGPVVLKGKGYHLGFCDAFPQAGVHAGTALFCIHGSRLLVIFVGGEGKQIDM
jgi:hypothetical protein